MSFLRIGVSSIFRPESTAKDFSWSKPTDWVATFPKSHKARCSMWPKSRTRSSKYVRTAIKRVFSLLKSSHSNSSRFFIATTNRPRIASWQKVNYEDWWTVSLAMEAAIEKKRRICGLQLRKNSRVWVVLYIEFTREELVYNFLRIPKVAEMNANIFENN